jgi:hypothetical protein
MEGMRRILFLNLLEPRMLAIGLIEVAVDADVLFDSLPRSPTSARQRC